MKLFISGRGTSFSAMKMSLSAEKAKKFLDRSKDGELFSSYQLASAIKIFVDTLRDVQRRIPEYTAKVNAQRWFGKPATIKQLLKESK